MNVTNDISSAKEFRNLIRSRNISKYYDNLLLVELYAYYFICIELVVILPAIFGNFFILFSIFKFGRLRTRLHILVANLALADLFVGLVLIPLDLYVIFNTKFYDTKLKCLGRSALNISFLAASVMNLFLISLERYIAIIHPLSHWRRCRKKRLVVWIILSWCLSFIVGFMPLWGVNSWEEGMPCDESFIFPNGYIGFIHLLLVSCLIINFILYIVVVKAALIQLDIIKTEGTAFSSVQKNRIPPTARKLRKSKVMIVILGTFAICWGPYMIVILLKTFIFPRDKNINVVEKFLAHLGLLNSGINWIIYGLKNKDFRNAFKRLITCRGNENSIENNRNRA